MEVTTVCKELSFTAASHRGSSMKIILVICLFLTSQLVTASEDKVLKIYHDSDYSNHNASARAMFMGMSTAFDEVNNTVQGFQLEIVSKDHRGNSIRSKQTMQRFLDDPSALFMMGGLHSPPYIKYRNYINENEILLLVPWAAGGPITRYADGTNWVFRLSIDDTKAGDTIMDFAASQDCKLPHLLLEDTPWGRSNYNTMSKASLRNYNSEAEVTWFNWNINDNAARTIIRPILEGNADCLLFVGNAIEGKKLFNTINDLKSDDQLKVFSHWGITGGDFETQVSHDLRQRLSLHVLQTCNNFNDTELSEQYKSVFARAQKLFPDTLTTPNKLQAQTGFIHAYDLGKIVITALNSIELSGNVKQDRANLRVALENLNQPVNGLLKTYNKPFSAWSKDNVDAHEALGKEDFCLAYYDADNRLLINK